MALCHCGNAWCDKSDLIYYRICCMSLCCGHRLMETTIGIVLSVTVLVMYWNVLSAGEFIIRTV